MNDIKDVCNYVIFRITSEGGGFLSHLKLQKILYYIQSWNLAYENKPFFDGSFEAWIHGPVNRTIYNSFKHSKYMYSSISLEDINGVDLDFPSLTQEAKDYINGVLEAYAPFSDVQLEKMTHDEKPWIEARGDSAPYQRCENIILERTMAEYYRARIVNG